jgi:NAD(P)-dependent dehydrogenase (short-subunit alcohol dehydrogenase family)
MSTFAIACRKPFHTHLTRLAITAVQRRRFMSLPAFSLENKTCVVTGAARGLGREFLTAFALSGARGACVDLSLQGGIDSIEHITEHVVSQSSTPSSYLPELRPYACDVASESQVRETWASIVSDFGKIDVVVTAAGIVENFEAENYPFDRWNKMLDINLNGSFLFAREAGRYWIDGNIKGNLILVSSMCSKIVVRPQKQAAYNVVRIIILINFLDSEAQPAEIYEAYPLTRLQSKSAVSMLGKTLAAEVRQRRLFALEMISCLTL